MYLLRLLLINSLSLISATKYYLTILILFSLNCCWSFSATPKFRYILWVLWELRSVIFKHLPWNSLELCHHFFKVIWWKRISKKLISKFFLQSIKSINPTQKYLHIIESSACILKIFVFTFSLPINVLISFGIYSTQKTIKVLSIITLYVQDNPMSSNIRVLIKIYYIHFVLYFIRQIIMWIHISKFRLIFIVFFYFNIRQWMNWKKKI